MSFRHDARTSDTFIGSTKPAPHVVHAMPRWVSPKSMNGIRRGGDRGESGSQAEMSAEIMTLRPALRPNKVSAEGGAGLDWGMHCSWLGMSLRL